MTSPRTTVAGRVLTAALVLATAGCARDKDQSAAKPRSLTVYCSVDEAFGRPVLEEFASAIDARVSIVFDSEAGKTTGLINRIIQEAKSGRPRADVFWSSELFNTIALAQRGLLAPYSPPSANDIPARFKDPKGYWTGMAVRARVIAFDPSRQSKEALPRRWADLSDERYAPRVAMANPIFGTTRGHVAAMVALWGSATTRTYLQQLQELGVTVSDGNSSAVRALIAGRVDFACTDTDDVWVAQQSGARIEAIYPDMGDGGTFLIPCSVAIIQGGENPELARKLVDYLASAKVERMLAKSASRNIPVRETLRRELNIDWPSETKIDYPAVADAMEEAVAMARETLLR
jgi:iron(III) transport system substrate-binding protein